VVSILLPFMPAEVDGGWREAGHKLQKRVVAALEPYGPGIADRIVESCVVTPADFVTRYENPHGDPHFLARLLASADSRVRTPMPGLFVCGASAEAADAISGAAGRLAARLVAAELPEQNGVKHEPD
jgi:phytoene dehydrogenase-like protein